MTPGERWLAALWPFVRDWLPTAPAYVLEVGCGPLGGFVPMLRASGHRATGVDPQAPPGPWYRQLEFERYHVPAPLDAIVACTSLHHVADLAGVIDLMGAALAPGGVVVIVEWAREQFDEATARWCFDQLPALDGDPGWLHKRRTRWRESGQSWDDFARSSALSESLHYGQDILAALDTRFESQLAARGPYFFPDIAAISEADEQAAIDAGLILANRIQYVGRRVS